ncbi:hypothetical protein [Marinobacter shengliensis]
MQKIDLSDRFWRMLVAKEERWNFCYVMPQPSSEPVRIVVPSALQMGWTESPGYFAATTETVRDVIQREVAEGKRYPEHPMEQFTRPLLPAVPSALSQPVRGHFVYIDDFINMAMQDNSQDLLGAINKVTMHNIHAFFPPPAVSGHTQGKDPISQKKLAKGDAGWDTAKAILGFQLDGNSRTVWLPPAKAHALLTELT